MKIEVGKVYRTRDGRHAVVTSRTRRIIYPWSGLVSERHETWTDDGSVFADGLLSSLDLVAEWVGEPETQVAEPASAPAEKMPALTGRRTIYLSGPMKGYPQSNYPLFMQVAAQLREQGHRVYNPAEFKHEGQVFPIRRAFAEYSKFICEEADSIVLLSGWEKSLGVSAELALAKNCGLLVIEHGVNADP